MLSRSGRRPRLSPVVFAIALALVATACSAQQQQASESTTTTTTTTTTVVDRTQTLRVAVVINEAAPTAEADDELEAILTEAAAILDPLHDIDVELRTVSVEDPGQAEGALSALINDGVSVVITGCDDATVPSVIEAANAAELLTVTGCVSLPRPDISGIMDTLNTDLFLDLSNLADNAPAILTHATTEGFENLAVVRSNLIPDVEQTCIDVASGAGGSEVVADVTFTELIDPPADVASVLNGALPSDADVGAIVVCALPPALGDIAAALRDIGLEQQIIAPWYGDTQTWAEGTDDLVIVAPASRHGDDPVDTTSELFEAMQETEFLPVAIDVVPADALAILVDAAERADSVGSQRIADMISESGPDVVVEAVSGAVSLNGPTSSPVLRNYRVISISDGSPSFESQVILAEDDGLRGG